MYSDDQRSNRGGGFRGAHGPGDANVPPLSLASQVLGRARKPLAETMMVADPPEYVPSSSMEAEHTTHSWKSYVPAGDNGVGLRTWVLPQRAQSAGTACRFVHQVIPQP